MSFLYFIFYYFICTIILIIIGGLIYKFLLHKQFNFISKTAEKEVDKYFNAYDDNKNIPEQNQQNTDISSLITLINKEIQTKIIEDSKNDDFLKEVK